MRDKAILSTFEEITLLKQYLYMGEDHAVTYHNGCVNLRLRMEDDLSVKARNTAFPDLPEMNVTSDMTDAAWAGVLAQLKKQAPEEITKKNGYRNPSKRIKTRWDEIRELTLINAYENRMV